MSKNTIYIIVTISLLHFVVAIVFLLRKLSGPSREDPVVASVLPFQTSSAFVPKIMAQFEPVLSEAALAVL
ncbi:MAG: hypothetical protein IPN76_16625 [Saprospiraceae bacterium]|nr:hypothetical protein [Saprospiraceae bacterium]